LSNTFATNASTLPLWVIPRTSGVVGRFAD
jgi:hypothetical protein